MLGKFWVPGRPTNFDDSRAWAYCACSRCGWVVGTFFLASIILLFFLPLRETARYRLIYCVKEPLTQNNQPTRAPNQWKQTYGNINSAAVAYYNLYIIIAYLFSCFHGCLMKLTF